jgi:hypothetical protein
LLLQEAFRALIGASAHEHDRSAVVSR